jgi:hypothetical protein
MEHGAGKGKSGAKLGRLASKLGRLALVLFLGQCLHSYNTCPDLAQAHPLLGTCGDDDDGAGPVPHALWPFLSLIVRVVERSVVGYFLLFAYNWGTILAALQHLIAGYYEVLEVVVDRLTSWPQCWAFVVALAISLLGVALIIQVTMSNLNLRSRAADKAEPELDSLSA